MIVADPNEFHALTDGVVYRDAKEPDGSNHPAVILRATYGNTHVDNLYASNLFQARRAGLMVGHYGYMVKNIDAALQGSFFGQTVKAHGGLLPGDSIWCDDEETMGGDESPRVVAFLNAAHAVLNDIPQDEGFYSGAAFFAAHLGLTPKGLHRWIASYGTPAPPDGEDLFQFTDNRIMPGVQGPCDASIFNGSGDQYRGLFSAPPAGPSHSNVTIGNLHNVVATIAGFKGFWIIQGDGGVFTFDGAAYYGSLGNVKLNKPISCAVATHTGYGYYLVAQDGGVFNFGDAKFYGSLGGQNVPQPIVGISLSESGHGYRLIDTIGTIYHFGDA